MGLNDDKFNIIDLINDIASLSKPLIREKGHILSVNISDVVHREVIGDREKLTQVFMNLISNAIKYTLDEGNIDLYITEKIQIKIELVVMKLLYKIMELV